MSDFFYQLRAPTQEQRVEEAADTIKRMVMRMKPGERLVVERHAEREPCDALITVTEIQHEGG